MVLAKLVTALHKFHYDPSRSFRAWLKTVTRHAWSDFLDQRRRTGGLDVDGTRFASLEARDDLERRVGELHDQELLEAAMTRVQPRVEPQTWEAFRLTALEGLTGAEAGQRLHMPVANVFVAKHRTQNMLRDEVRRLAGDEAESP
jgi:RNA polymerase sigma-70 factor (ECF subfamily)